MAISINIIIIVFAWSIRQSFDKPIVWIITSNGDGKIIIANLIGVIQKLWNLWFSMHPLLKGSDKHHISVGQISVFVFEYQFEKVS